MTGNKIDGAFDHALVGENAAVAEPVSPVKPDMVAGADGPSRPAEARAIAARPSWAAAGTHGVEFTPLAELELA